jgi:hypothetical protein
LLPGAWATSIDTESASSQSIHHPKSEVGYMCVCTHSENLIFASYAKQWYISTPAWNITAGAHIGIHAFGLDQSCSVPLLLCCLGGYVCWPTA